MFYVCGMGQVECRATNNAGPYSEITPLITRNERFVALSLSVGLNAGVLDAGPQSDSTEPREGDTEKGCVFNPFGVANTSCLYPG